MTLSDEADPLPVCRICLVPSDPSVDGCEPDTDLIRTCKCSGSVAYIHANCFRQWLKRHRSNICEICRSEYEVPLTTIRAGSYLEYVRVDRVAAVELFMFAMMMVYIGASLLMAKLNWAQVGHRLQLLVTQLDANPMAIQTLVVATLTIMMTTTSIMSVAYHLGHYWQWRHTNVVYELDL
ncbi:E3 ubiquitin-protein ligase MARCHF2 [Halotydeus destructor]|nr:E3 ubiquitin-protein ligase MARCHF2 [Halotydeus destructor]